MSVHRNVFAGLHSYRSHWMLFSVPKLSLKGDILSSLRQLLRMFRWAITITLHAPLTITLHAPHCKSLHLFSVGCIVINLTSRSYYIFITWYSQIDSKQIAFNTVKCYTVSPIFTLINIHFHLHFISHFDFHFHHISTPFYSLFLSFPFPFHLTLYYFSHLEN